MYYPNSNDWWLDPSQGRFDIRANGGAPVAALDSLGRLGIGTTSPAATLQVNQTSVSQPAVSLMSAASGNSAVLFIGYGSGGHTGNGLTMGAANSGDLINATGSVGSGYFRVTSPYNANPNLYLSGSVGIGTASPGYKLDVQGGQINASGGLCMNNICQTVWPSGGITGSGASGQVSFWNGAASQAGDPAFIWDLSSKRLGIGGSPQLSLDVVTTGSTDGIRIKKTNDTAGAPPVLYFDRLKTAAIPSQGDMLGWMRFRGVVEDDAWIQAVVDAAAGAITKSPASLIFFTSPAAGSGFPIERLRITSTGNIGIGMTNPAAKLALGGTAGTDGILFPDGTLQTSAAGSSKVQTQTTTGGTSVTFTGLVPGALYRLDFNALQNTTNGNQYIRFNGDSGANYYNAVVGGSGISAGSVWNQADNAVYPQSNGLAVTAGNMFSAAFQFTTVPGSANIVQGIGNCWAPFRGVDGYTSIQTYGARYTGASALSSMTISTTAGTMTGTFVLTRLN